jgi:hypothetical protein
MRKPAPLAVGVLLKKGQAAPMFDSQGRDGPSTASPSTAIERPTPVPVMVPSDPPGRTRTADLEPLGFKVPPQFNQEFRRFAFENGYKLNELLFAAFDAFKKGRIRESANS